jgi:hypothetical protein
VTALEEHSFALALAADPTQMAFEAVSAFVFVAVDELTVAPHAVGAVGDAALHGQAI